ncbi:MAG: hypothetical protein U0932_04315 [Thiobacillus sp.]|nr:hypothetical protein [Thiobacillus sp.]
MLNGVERGAVKGYARYGARHGLHRPDVEKAMAWLGLAWRMVRDSLFDVIFVYMRKGLPIPANARTPENRALAELSSMFSCLSTGNPLFFGRQPAFVRLTIMATPSI